ncbi:hypothetical protein PIB30_071870 [Stylosanthes scabra]|uniref:Uncharacterized protein n=1 Tax=Stylosanthes scabra TaxID=79078 RepID=A0ABU6SP16_9FABA|nr:hypothetical protein [Stylosanthes scabra]
MAMSTNNPDQPKYNREISVNRARLLNSIEEDEQENEVEVDQEENGNNNQFSEEDSANEVEILLWKVRDRIQKSRGKEARATSEDEGQSMSVQQFVLWSEIKAEIKRKKVRRRTNKSTTTEAKENEDEIGKGTMMINKEKIREQTKGKDEETKMKNTEQGIISGMMSSKQIGEQKLLIWNYREAKIKERGMKLAKNFTIHHMEGGGVYFVELAEDSGGKDEEKAEDQMQYEIKGWDLGLVENVKSSLTLKRKREDESRKIMEDYAE